MFAGRWLPMIDYVKKHEGSRPLIGAEVGVFAGEGSLYILNNLNIRLLHLIDPYNLSDTTYKDLCRDTLPAAYQKATIKLIPFEKQVKWWVMTSNEAAVSISGDLDFVYIDANHDYIHAMTDIVNYSKLVKPGGYVGGHDYVSGHACMNGKPIIQDGEPMILQVKDAVDEYVLEHGMELHIAFEPERPEDGAYDHPDWWFRKPL